MIIQIQRKASTVKMGKTVTEESEVLFQFVTWEQNVSSRNVSFEFFFQLIIPFSIPSSVTWIIDLKEVKQDGGYRPNGKLKTEQMNKWKFNNFICHWNHIVC